MNTPMLPREWLSTQKGKDGKPLAIFPSRGRLSREAHEVLEKAKAQGMTFAEPTATAFSVKKAAAKPVGETKPVKDKPKPDIDPKAVRTWATEKGLPVAERGRVSTELVSAYLADCESKGEAPAKVSEPLSDYREAAPARYNNVYFKVTDLDGKERKMTPRTACSGCGYSFFGCLCASPKVFSLVDIDKLITAYPTREVVKTVSFW